MRLLARKMMRKLNGFLFICRKPDCTLPRRCLAEGEFMGIEAKKDGKFTSYKAGFRADPHVVAGDGVDERVGCLSEEQRQFRAERFVD